MHSKLGLILVALLLVGCGSLPTVPVTAPPPTSSVTPILASTATPTVAPTVTTANIATPRPTATVTENYTPVSVWAGLPNDEYIVYQVDETDTYVASLDGAINTLIPDVRGYYLQVDDVFKRLIYSLAEPGLWSYEFEIGSQVRIPIPEQVDDVFSPVWSPASSENLVFVSGYRLHNLPINGDGSFLYVAAPDGTAQLIVQGADPVWSPDGKRIAFSHADYGFSEAGLPEPDTDLYLLDTDCLPDPAACQLVELTALEPEAAAYKPSWSADGTSLVFECLLPTAVFDERQSDVCLIEVEGSGLRNLTETEGVDETGPMWSKDGLYIGYTVTDPSTRYQDIVIYSVSDGKAANMTNSANQSEELIGWLVKE